MYVTIRTEKNQYFSGGVFMKIGTCVHLNDINEMSKKLDELLANGFDSCQLISWKPEVWTDENAEIMNRLIKEKGVTVSAFWCGWEGPCISNYPQFAPFCVAVRQVAEHLKQNGQYLLFETGQETPVTMLRCFEKVGTDNLGVNLDTANVILYGRANPVDALDVFGKYVRNIHAKDGKYPTNGHDLGEETRIGEGKVDFNRLFERLHEIGYDSYITIEREIEGEEQNKDILYAKEYLGSIIERVYGEPK